MALADRYTIERQLGAGGMATVYLAQDLRHGRRVAIKVLRPELSAVIGSERFLAEIKLTAALQHPHILPLFDSGEADGLLFYVMPHVEGETLRARLVRETQLSIADAVRIATEVAAALDYAHRHGVIHRDIKPENILLHDGSALVADFGIALAVTAANGGRITETGMSVGTPQYMAPEQAMGEREITGRADIYALGVVTYEMLVGEPPFTGPSTQAIVAKVMTDDPRPLIPQRRSIPPEVEATVLTALEKLPADRYEHASDFAAELEGGKAGRRTTGSQRRLRAARAPWWRRGVGAALAAVMLLVAGIALGRLVTPSRGAPIELGHSRKMTWDRGLEMEPALSPDGRYVAYAAGTTANMRLYVRQVTGGRPTRLTDDSLAIQTNPSWSADGARVLFLADGGVYSAPSSGGAARPEMPRPAGSPVTTAAWAPDGRTIAYAIADSLYLRAADGTTRALARVEEASLCQWSPRGDLIACTSGNAYYTRIGRLLGNLSPSRVVVVRASDGVAALVTDSTSINQSPVWSRDGRWLYLVSSRDGPRDIYGVKIEGGKAGGEVVRLTTGLGAHTISISADGTRMAYATYNSTANIWSLPFPPEKRTQAAAVAVTGGSQVVEGIDVSADGKWLYYSSDVSGNSDLYRMRLPDGDPEQLTTDPADEFSPKLSPDGRFLAFHSWRGGSRDLYVMPLDGGPVQRVMATPIQESQPTWSPDGNALTFAHFGAPGSIWVVRRTADGGWGTPVMRAPFGSWPAWSPDGRTIAYVSYFMGGSLMAVSPDSGAPRTIVDSARTGILAETPLWSADSRTIYFKSHDSFKSQDAAGNAAYWSIPVTGGAATLLTRFDDPARASYRPEWGIGGGRMYFTIGERESDVWVVEVKGR